VFGVWRYAAAFLVTLNYSGLLLHELQLNNAKRQTPNAKRFYDSLDTSPHTCFVTY